MTCSSSEQDTSHSGPIGNGQAYTRWSDATVSRAMTVINLESYPIREGQ